MPSQTKKITIDTAALFTGRAVGLLLGMVRLNYLATYLGVANFGVLNGATYFTSLFQTLFDLGLSQLLTRELSRDLSRSRELLGRAVVLKVMMVFVAGLLVGIAAFFSRFDRINNWAVLLTTAAVAINGISMAFLSAFQAHRKMILVSIANIANDALTSAAVILLLPRYPGITTPLVLMILVSLINLALLVRVYIHTVGMPEFRVDLPTWKLLLREGTPMAVSSFGISTYTFIGPTVLKYARGEVEVGIYSAGYKLISILTLIPMAFTQVVYPVFSEFYANAKHKLAKALQDSLRVMAMVSIPLAVGTVVLAPRIIALLYPSSYSDAAPVLQLQIAGVALGYPAWVLYAFLLAIDRQRFCMVNSLAVGALVLVASLLAVPRFGYVGVAAISPVTDIILFVTLFTYAMKAGFHFTESPGLAKILLAASGMGLLVYFIRGWPVIPVVASGVVAYVVILFALRSFGDQEREILTKLLKR